MRWLVWTKPPLYLLSALNFFFHYNKNRIFTLAELTFISCFRTTGPVTKTDRHNFFWSSKNSFLVSRHKKSPSKLTMILCCLIKNIVKWSDIRINGHFISENPYEKRSEIFGQNMRFIYLGNTLVRKIGWFFFVFFHFHVFSMCGNFTSVFSLFMTNFPSSSFRWLFKSVPSRLIPILFYSLPFFCVVVQDWFTENIS